MLQLGEPWSDLDGHVLCLPGNDWERKNVLAEWVRRGFGLRELIVIVDPYLFDPDRSARTALLQHSVNADVAVEHGRMVILEPQDFWPPHAAPAMLQDALASGMTGMRITTQLPQMVAALGDVDPMEVERVVAAFCDSAAVSALCQYDHNDLVQDSYVPMMKLHQRTHEAQVHIASDTHGVSLIGSIDVHNAALCEAALTATSAEIALDIDLSGLTFADVTGCRALVDGTAAFRRTGGTVRLVGTSERIDRLLRELDFDSYFVMSQPS